MNGLPEKICIQITSNRSVKMTRAVNFLLHETKAIKEKKRKNKRRKHTRQANMRNISYKRNLTEPVRESKIRLR